MSSSSTMNLTICIIIDLISIDLTFKTTIHDSVWVLFTAFCEASLHKYLSNRVFPQPVSPITTTGIPQLRKITTLIPQYISIDRPKAHQNCHHFHHIVNGNNIRRIWIPVIIQSNYCG